MEKRHLKNLLEVFLTLQITKELPRQGFLYSGFKRNEADSVAAHSFNVSAFSYMLARELKKQGLTIDPQKVLTIALVHDMAEAITGDIGTWVKVFAGGKFDEIEEKAFRLLVRNLTDKEELIALFKEYNGLLTLESQVVKIVDSLDALAQGLNTPGANIEDWTLAVNNLIKKKLQDKSLRKLFEQAVELLFNREVTYMREHIDTKKKDSLEKYF